MKWMKTELVETDEEWKRETEKGRNHKGVTLKRLRNPGNFNIWNLLKGSSKKINIEFRPKYWPFLNPINLDFKIIKIDVKHTGI